MLCPRLKLIEGSCYHHPRSNEWLPSKLEYSVLPNEYFWTIWAELDVFDDRFRAVFVTYDTTRPNKITAASDILGLSPMLALQNSNRRVTEAWQSFRKVYYAADKI